MSEVGSLKTPVKLLHALLLHGQGNESRNLGQIWPLVVDPGGKAISRNTGTKVVQELEQLELVTRDPPKLGLRFGLGLGTVIGASIGTQSLRVGLFDANGSLLTTHTRGRGSALTGWHAYEELHTADQLAAPMDELLDRLVGAIKAVALRAVNDQAVLVDGRLPFLGVAVAWPTPLNCWTKVPTGLAMSDSAWRTSDGPGEDVVGIDLRVGDRLGFEPELSSALNDANALALVSCLRS